MLQQHRHRREQSRPRRPGGDVGEQYDAESRVGRASVCAWWRTSPSCSTTRARARPTAWPASTSAQAAHGPPTRAWSPAPRPTSRTSSSRGTRAGYDGVRLRPAVLPDDLDADLLPELRARGLARTAYDADSLRGLLALPTDVPNRFAA